MIDDTDILTLLSAELAASDPITSNGNSAQGLEEALDYYLGNPNGTEVQGRSQVTSTDVADAIEWIMPQVMKSFTQSNEVVVFDPVSEGDEEQAEIESEYVYDVIMKQNKGFISIHTMVKDALMQNNGVLKVYYEAITETEYRSFTGIPREHVEAILANPAVELLEKSEYDEIDDLGNSHQVCDIRVEKETNSGKISIDTVPLESFRINSQHNSIDPSEARFTAHIVEKTISELVSEGYDLDELLEMPTGTNYTDKEYRFSAQGDETNIGGDISEDRSQRLLEVAECFIHADLEGKGISKLYKIVAVGGDDPTHILSVEEIESTPWVTTTAILMSHKFKGLSIFDRLKEIQNQKTALWRNMFDNLYLQNNQRNIVVEGQVNMDDLLVSRPGGIIRTKRTDSIVPLITPQMNGDAQNMMGYLDEVRAGRVGVSAEGAATPQNVGDSVGSQGVDRLMSAKEELVGLIIRVIAETGIKPLCIKVRDESRKHIDTIKDFKFKGKWVQLNPADWGNRVSTTVRVGTGTGDRQQQVGSIQNIITMQKEALATPGQAICNEQKVYDAINDYCKFSGLNSASKYFVNPSSDEGKEARQKADEQSKVQQEQEQQMQQQMAEAQQKVADAEVEKAKAQMANIHLKGQIESGKGMLQQQKQEYEAQLRAAGLQIQEDKQETDMVGRFAEMEFRYNELEQRTALELTRIESASSKEATEENENYTHNKETASGNRE